MKKRTTTPRLAAAATLSFLTLLALPGARAQNYVWLEAEDGQGWDAIPGMNTWENALYSNGKMVQMTIGAGEASDNAFGAEGKIISWPFTIPAAGAHDFWFRLGYEYNRPDIEWRVDGGGWTVFPKTVSTLDLRQTAMFCELAWALLAEGLQLAAGAHTLEIRMTAQTKEDGSPERTLFGADAMVFAPPGVFKPYNHFKPGQDHRTDADREAAEFVFNRAGASSSQADPQGSKMLPLLSIPLAGQWEIARSDEWYRVDEADRLQPMSALPEDLDTLRWSAIPVPGDLLRVRPDYTLAHRMLYRARVFVPESWAGRSFQLHVPNFSMIIGAFVNRQYVGGTKNGLAPWTVDATSAVRPGEVNEIIFSIKDRWYGFCRGGGDEASQKRWAHYGARMFFGTPPEHIAGNWMTQHFDMPFSARPWIGLLETPSLQASGPVYAADVFVKPQISRRELAVEYEIHNPSARAVEVEVGGSVWPWAKGVGAVKDGAPVFEMPARKMKILPGETAKTELIAKYRVQGDAGTEEGGGIFLWWPTDPRLYVLSTTVKSADGTDMRETRFGFREWGWNSDLFTLNGVPWQFWADCTGGEAEYAPSFFAYAKKTGQNLVRMWRWTNRREYLEAMDEAGMAVRSSCGLEGMGGNYLHGLIRQGFDAAGRRVNVAFRPLFDNWREQLLAQVKGERNHPSILIWSVENEIVYINANNLGMAAQAEPEIRRGAQAVEVMDPTRPTMVDGGRALKDQSMPVNGAHYDDYAGRQRRDLPDGFYDNSVTYTAAGKLHGDWIMAKGKPVFHGEAFFANGWKPSELSMFGGDAAALGRAAAFPARSLYAKMLSEGYRWDGVAAWHMWLEAAAPNVYWTSWQPVAALCREWDRSFAAGKNFPRTLRLFNQTQFGTPITVRWALHVPGEEPANWGERAFTLAPGGRSDPFVVQIAAGNLVGDEVAAGRGARVFTVRCVRDGEEIFREDKNVWILNPDAAPKPNFGEGGLYVWDAHGSAKKRLEARGIAFTEVAGLDEVPQGARLIVGTDTIGREQSSSSAWQRFALAGGRVVMLDQAHPLRHQALSVEAEPTDFIGRIAFLENPDHPVFAGLNNDDFFCRSVDHITYRNVWRKSPSLKSLAQCDEELGFSAYFETPAADGLLALCQFAVGKKLDSGDPVMTRLFDNLVNRLADYTPIRKEVRSLFGADTPAGKSLSRTGAWTTQHARLETALANPDQAWNQIIALPMEAAAGDDEIRGLRAFMEAGGWLVVNGLTPENLAAFNLLSGVDNRLRPMAMERVQFAPRRDWAAAGLSTADLVMDTGKKMFDWMELREPVRDMYNHVVDAPDDLAPFSPGPYSPFHNEEHIKKHVDGNSRNMVNGFTVDDTWMWIWQTGTGEAATWYVNWDKPWPLATIEIAPNHGYQRIKTVELYFDDDPEPQILEFANDKSPQSFDVTGRTAQKLFFKPTEYHPLENRRGQLTGIDTLRIFVARDDAWRATVHPIDNIGGLVRYSVGKGGLVLMNLNFQDEETNPVNMGKKNNIFKTLLANLGAVFAEGGRPTAGWRLNYRPISIPQKFFNIHLVRDQEPSWFHQGNRDDLGRIPTGEQMFADVRFTTSDFRTSPAAAAISLAGSAGRLPAEVAEVTDIPVGGKADCLFFLHTWNAHHDLWGRRLHAGDPRPWPMFKYRVNYADGESVEVPVAWQRDIGHWQMETPSSYPNAALAWIGPTPEGSLLRPVVYAMQWDNPSPEKDIASVDMLREANGRWGCPALLAITAAVRNE